MVQMPYYCYYILRIKITRAELVGAAELATPLGPIGIGTKPRSFFCLAGKKGYCSLAIGGSAMRTTISLRYYAMALGMISGGLAMVGLAQALRLLLEVNGRG
jgi:hypothetical protein